MMNKDFVTGYLLLLLAIILFSGSIMYLDNMDQEQADNAWTLQPGMAYSLAKE